MLLIRLMVRDRTTSKGHPIRCGSLWSLEPQSAARLILCYPTQSAGGVLMVRYRHACVSALSHAGPERD
jgi:hypothetical protein